MQIIETPKQLYLVMEYASGGELFDFIVANSRVKEEDACRFYQQLIDGIEYIHKLGIVHRDLKPENLLLDYKKNIKIVDFGLSNTYQQGELLKTACGSPCYAAPEVKNTNDANHGLDDRRKEIQRVGCGPVELWCYPLRNDMRLLALRRPEHFEAVQENPGRRV